MTEKHSFIGEIRNVISELGLSKQKAYAISDLLNEQYLFGKVEISDDISPQQIVLLALQKCIASPASYEEEIKTFIVYLTNTEKTLSPLELGKLFHLKAITLWRIDQNLLMVNHYLNNSIDVLAGIDSHSAKAYLARVFDTYGQVLVSQGLLIDAGIEYKKALKSKKEHNDIDGQAITLGNMGRLAMQLGDFESGINYLEKDLSLIRQFEGNHDDSISKLLSNLSWCHIALSDPEQAKTCNDESYKINKKNNNYTGLAFNMLNRAEIALLSNKPKEARAYINKLEEIIEGKSIAVFMIQSLTAYKLRVEALLNFMLGRHLDANVAFDKAIKLFSQESSISEVATANLLYKYAQLAIQSNNIDFAGKLYRSALRLIDGSEEHKLRNTIEEEMKSNYEDSWLLHNSGRFLGHDQIDFLLKEAGGENFRGEEKEVVVLFSDLRGFTPISEALEASEVIQLLNGFLTRMTKAIKLYGGFVDKFMGDAIMAIFSLPSPRPYGINNDSDNAVMASLMMKEELRRMNQNLPEELPKLKMGIGLHSGKVTAGLIGSPQKRSYTVIGDVVNTTARLEGMTKMLGSEILITSEVKTRLTRNDLLLRPLGKFCPKGRKQHIEVTEVIGVDDGSPRLIEIKSEIGSLQKALDFFYQRNFAEASSVLTDLINKTTNPHYKIGYKFLNEEIKKRKKLAPDDVWQGEIVLGKK